MQLIQKLACRKHVTGGYSTTWGLFLCSVCNKEVEKRLDDGKKYTSCGCNRFKHRGAGSRLYKIWKSMKERCLNPNNWGYKNYGGRGIRVCNEWLEYINFRDWALNNGYKDDLEIDRENNNGNYELNNCRWTTNEINSQNRRSIRLNLELAEEIRKKYLFDKYTCAQLVKEYGVSQPSISSIIHNRSWKKAV